MRLHAAPQIRPDCEPEEIEALACAAASGRHRHAIADKLINDELAWRVWEPGRKHQTTKSRSS